MKGNVQHTAFGRLLSCVLAIMFASTYTNGIAVVSRNLGYGTLICAGYTFWSTEYAVSDHRTDYYITSADENNRRTIFMDDIAVTYDNSNLEAVDAVLFFTNCDTRASDIVDRWKRAACLYCAIEFGSPLNPQTDVEASKASADNFIKNMNEVMMHRIDDLKNGKRVPFQTGNGTTYYLMYFKDENRWIIYVM